MTGSERKCNAITTDSLVGFSERTRSRQSVRHQPRLSCLDDSFVCATARGCIFGERRRKSSQSLASEVTRAAKIHRVVRNAAQFDRRFGVVGNPARRAPGSLRGHYASQEGIYLSERMLISGDCHARTMLRLEEKAQKRPSHHVLRRFWPWETGN